MTIVSHAVCIAIGIVAALLVVGWHKRQPDPYKASALGGLAWENSAVETADLKQERYRDRLYEESEMAAREDGRDVVVIADVVWAGKRLAGQV